MTNLIATIIVSISTNWTTVSTTYPAQCDVPGCLVLHLPTENQVAIVSSNTVAIIDWKGVKVKAVLESVEIGKAIRSVAVGLYANGDMQNERQQ
jgi:hypothetical protein